MSKTLYLIDTYGQIFRSFFAIRGDMRSPVTGEPTQALFGMTGYLLKLLRQLKPDYVVAVIDAPGPTFRDELHDAYKATRNETPGDLTAQFPRIFQLIDTLGIQQLGCAGLEADDVIAGITRQILADPACADVKIRIASKDKDLLQLLNDRVTLYDVQTETETDVAALRESKGITPAQVIDYLTLTGDSVDNVPGVPGIGPKTAAQLLQEYGTLEGIYTNLASITGRKKELLAAAQEQALRSRVLVTLKDDGDHGFRLEDARPRGIDIPAALELFRQLDFKRFADEVIKVAGVQGAMGGLFTEPEPAATPVAEAAVLPSIPLPEILTETLTRAEDLALLAQKLRARSTIGPEPAGPVCISVQKNTEGAPAVVVFAWEDDTLRAAVIPLRTVEGPAAEPGDFAAAFASLLADADVPKILHDGKATAHALLALGGRAAPLILRGVDFDTHLAAQLGDCASADLGALARDLAGLAMETGDDLEARAVDRAVAVLLVTPPLRSLLASRGMGMLLSEIEAPLAPILAGMEHAGILCDPAVLARQGEALGARVVELKQQVYDAAGFSFDLNSSQQLAVALFDKLGLTPGKKTKTGYSTDKEVLEALADEEDPEDPRTSVPRIILEYRQLTKLLSTYLGNLQQAIHPDTGRIHTTFRQLATATGRLASDGPNLQNIPVRSEIGRQIRLAFHAPAGEALISADYSQIELRVLAHLSGDIAMIDAFEKGLDIHTAVAMQVFGVESPESVTRSQRDQAKTINFGIVYGISPFGLARRIKALDRAAAGELIAQYRARYSGIDRFLQECIDKAKSDGYVTTIAGRRRPIPEIRTKATAQLGERLAINTVVQGSAADLIKRAMVRVDDRIRRDNLPALMLLQIHDELLFEAPVMEAKRCAEAIQEEMQSAFELRVPLVAEYGMGDNWRDAK